MYPRAELNGAKWIGTGVPEHPFAITRTFAVCDPRHARITVACFGTFVLTVNGRRVGEDLYLPLTSDYEERHGIVYGGTVFDEQLSHRLYCPQFDISDYLREGDNTLQFSVAGGFYELWGFGIPKLAYCVEIDGKQIVSDGTELCGDGFVKEAHSLRGETHDYRTVLSDDTPVTVFDTPDTPCYLCDCPADTVIRTVRPRLLGNGIYDAGEVLSGYVTLKSKKAQTVTVRYAELLDEYGNLCGEAKEGQYSTYHTDDAERLLYPRHTWNAFRYFQVSGDIEVVECAVVHSKVDITAVFDCSDDTLNWLYTAFLRTQLANMHGGIPSDCPHIERRGYTGDGQLTCAAAMMQLDAQAFYKKWIADILDCQDKQSGHVQYTAPFTTAGGGPGGWGCAIVEVPYQYWRAYGDHTILYETFDAMAHWFDYMETHSEDGLVTSDRKGVWCLGEWCPPSQGEVNLIDAVKIPPDFVNTYFYVRSMQRFLQIAATLRDNRYTETVDRRIKTATAALTRRYYDPETGDFANGEQGANAFALDIGLGDERTLQRLVDRYQTLGQYDTGIFGTDIVTCVLFERGYADLAVTLLTSKKETSFYQQIQRGATTLHEYWNDRRSQCHPMFGAVTRYLYEYVLGIRQTKDSVGYERIVIDPCCRTIIPRAKGRIATVHGTISVEYDEKTLTVTIPAGVDATVQISGSSHPVEAGTHRFKCI